MADNLKRLVWDKVGNRRYETGTDRGVLFPMLPNGQYGDGVAWDGLTGVSESPSGAEPSPLYADNIKYLNLISAEEYSATIEAYSSPAEFDACDGSAEIAEGVTIGQQTRQKFGFAYRTKIGTDVNDEAGYKIHLVYGCTAAPSGRDYATVNESPEAMTLSWEVNTTPVDVPNSKPTATVTIDSTKVAPEKLAAFEEILYGKDPVEGTPGVAARLPLPSEVATLFAAG